MLISTSDVKCSRATREVYDRNRLDLTAFVSFCASMRLHPLSLSLLLLLVAGAAVVCVTVTTPFHGFRGCAVREFSFVAQKPGCRSLRITTEACWGRCHTWEKPVPEPSYIQRHHRVCTYSRSRYASARLPGCRPPVSPLYHYPVAVHCHCAVCSTLDTECETF
ncbi:glycoprotein hormone beta-5-like isoform X1 [Betta splendens]|uniref:Glycoprotein hormone beta-5-like isoform X1 n=1 Tax=Betta splendens TaxID=158456 RepID=A0A6P7NXX9_BETSP|nr:glycoprotein hormone beta-5-like isoform X1 [Betta splendens]